MCVPDVSEEDVKQYISSFNKLPEKLTRKQTVRLAAAIAAENMPVIAEGYLGIDDMTISNMQVAYSGHAEAFNREILRQWSNASEIQNPVQVCAGNF